MKTKSINDISKQLDRIHKAAYNNYIRNGLSGKGFDIQDKARMMADRYYMNIWNELGHVSHSHDENITKQNTRLTRRIYAGY